MVIEFLDEGVVMNFGIKTIIFPVKDLAKANHCIPVYWAYPRRLTILIMSVFGKATRKSAWIRPATPRA